MCCLFLLVVLHFDQPMLGVRGKRREQMNALMDLMFYSVCKLMKSSGSVSEVTEQGRRDYFAANLFKTG